jgi:DNA repair protein RecO
MPGNSLNHFPFYGIILKVKSFGEGNSILTVLDREKGKIEGFSFGSSREKSKKRSAILVSHLVSGVLSQKQPQSLPSVKEINLERSYPSITSHFPKLSYLYFLFEVLNTFLGKECPFPLFSLLLETLDKMELQEESEKYVFALLIYFLQKEGFMPFLEEENDFQQTLKDLSKDGFTIGNGTLSFIRDVQSENKIDFLDSKRLSPSVIENLLALFSLLYCYHFGRKLAALELILNKKSHNLA